MSLAYKLLGMSRASRKYTQYIQAYQAESLPRSQAFSQIKESLVVDIPSDRFRVEWGILNSARKKWGVMNLTKRNETVINGYQRVNKHMFRQYKTIMRIKVINQDTGEPFEMTTTILHDRKLTRATLRRKAIRAIKQHSDTKLEFRKDTLAAGYRSMPYPGMF